MVQCIQRATFIALFPDLMWAGDCDWSIHVWSDDAGFIYNTHRCQIIKKEDGCQTNSRIIKLKCHFQYHDWQT